MSVWLVWFNASVCGIEAFCALLGVYDSKEKAEARKKEYFEGFEFRNDIENFDGIEVEIHEEQLNEAIVWSEEPRLEV